MTLPTSTWTGASKTLWTSTASWSTHVLPDAGTVVDIAAGSVLNYKGPTRLTMAELDVSGTLNIANGGDLVVSTANGGTGLLDISGGSVSFNTTGGTLELDGGITGNVTIGFATTGTPGTLWWNTANPLGSNLTLNNFFAGTTPGSTPGDTLEVTTASWDGTYDFDNTTNVLTLGGVGGVTLTHTANASDRDYTTTDFSVVDNAGTLVITDTYPCFLYGTRIATLRGEVAVEALRIGDLVITAAGDALPVRWIGTRGFIASMIHPHHRAALLPIRIAAGALGEGCPVRDLYVSPEHMLCCDDVLIPAGKLLNGTSITRTGNAELDVIQYFHIELSRHTVLYAEGAPAESFLDTGNRNMFSNVLSYLDLGPSLGAPPPSQQPCLPVVTAGEALVQVRGRLAVRAAGLGLICSTEDGLHLQVDGFALRPVSRDGDSARFAIPAGARQVRIVSRSAIPADLDPANADRRTLGICFAAMSLHDDSFALDLAPGFTGFTTGFHAGEDDHRWTNGDALLPEEVTAAMPDGFTLEIRLVRTGLNYPPQTAAAVVPLAARTTASQVEERLSA